MTVFLLLQLTGVPATLNKYPDVDFRSSVSPPQSASLKPVQSAGSVLEYCTAKLIVPARYLKICFTAFQCCSVGLAVNLATVLTAKTMSGLVLVDR